MSDPVSNVEIEDVLSSIRRLVSDENRNGPRAKPQGEPRKPSRLVLTPSLLVPVTDDAGPDAKPLEMSDVEVDALGAGIDWSDSDAEYDDWFESARDKQEDNPKASDSGSEDLALDTPEDHADIDSGPSSEDGSNAEAVSQDLSEPDQGETSDQKTDDAPWRDPDATLFEAAESAVPEEDLHDDDDNSAEEDSFVDDEEVFDEPAEPAVEPFADVPFSHVRVEDEAVEDEPVEDELVEDETVEEPALEEAHVQPDADDMTGRPSQDADPVTDSLEDLALENLELDEDAGQDHFDETEEPAAPVDDVTHRTATLSDKIAELEAKIGQTRDQWEPDGEMGDDYAGTRVETIEWQDHETEVDVTSEIPESDFVSDEPESAPADEPDTSADQPEQQDLTSDQDKLDFLGSDDAILDEESLRELVADIVRQELQGALGERITRNVRKLVRREIHRALTAQELD